MGAAKDVFSFFVFTTDLGDFLPPMMLGAPGGGKIPLPGGMLAILLAFLSVHSLTMLVRRPGLAERGTAGGGKLVG